MYCHHYSLVKATRIFGSLIFLFSVWAKDHHGMVLKRRHRDPSDIKWTFYFDGLPHDPTVKIDTRIDNGLSAPPINGASSMEGKEKSLHIDDSFQEDDIQSILDSETPELKFGMSMSLAMPSYDFRPTASPSVFPTSPPYPSPLPSLKPTSAPSTSVLPTNRPTVSLSGAPSLWPSSDPTAIHSGTPSVQLSERPSQSVHPSNTQSHYPSISPHPSIQPSNSITPSVLPSLSNHPTSPPSKSRLPSLLPTTMPSMLNSSVPSRSVVPSIKPSLSFLPSTDFPSFIPSLNPTNSQNPSSLPSGFPSSKPSAEPTELPSNSPTLLPSQFPSVTPSSFPSRNPTSSPSNLPSYIPSRSPQPSLQPSPTPTLSGCAMTPQQRRDDILEILDNVTNPVHLRNSSFPQYQALQWLLEEDGLVLCPANDKHIVQRWTLAIMYYATEGDQWFRCSNSPSPADNCGSEPPFQNGERRFLSSFHECEWAGLVCNIDRCVTEFEFERNNIVGYIPTEIGLLRELEVLGMEQGGLQGTIPNEIGQLENLVFMDLDFNLLTGSLPPGLLSLTKIQQLDLNDNLLTGSINDVGVFSDMSFFQLHDNFFTGTVPEDMGAYSKLEIFTLHGTSVTGTMPDSVCFLRTTGNLKSLIADCLGSPPEIQCSCCTDCRA
mmetsp:Transcript_28059/g.41443  ORF Transcript_28059/g.41443 Transcript_28059/m.41443 type:complete len:659 (+) Transcript_28059:501-2477(+)|eukprot:CAMPEP_0194215930 /NCGR_PEP_ID=MMETSP0156-20130528/18072_1 /TAXON_ID=33649 /ORGANISM="Thalassionema nitzschioides, Strain L26-B" /LENGTH=658 /DNA_ID=CAMNT_0038944575 /DNA_START=385 /DNA_END=2361 /DNA_ORIENTATION=-